MENNSSTLDGSSSTFKGAIRNFFSHQCAEMMLIAALTALFYEFVSLHLYWMNVCIG